MKASVSICCGLLATALLASTTACVQMPSENRQVADMRPQISFAFDSADTAVSASRVFVDGLEVGLLADFARGKSALRVLPGTHTIRVERSGQVVLEEKTYLGDGVSRSFIVP